MKTLIIAAALAASGMAHAATIAWLPNRAGSYIAFTDQPCRQDSQDRYVYGRDPDGRTAIGCWRPDRSTEMAFVTWSDGTFYTYPMSSLRMPTTSRNAQ